MGSKFFRPHTIAPTGTNLEARAFSAPSYAGRAAAGKNAKDIGAAQVVYANARLKPTTKDAASDAPGPKGT